MRMLLIDGTVSARTWMSSVIALLLEIVSDAHDRYLGYTRLNVEVQRMKFGGFCPSCRKNIALLKRGNVEGAYTFLAARNAAFSMNLLGSTFCRLVGMP